MACEILKELNRRGSLPDKYLILETSADLRQRQQQAITKHIPELLSRVVWLDGLPETPINGVIVANEVLDALPVYRIKFIDNVIHDMQVCWPGDRFAWSPQPITADLEAKAHVILGQTINQLPDNYTTEINVDIEPWLQTLTEHLCSGVMLFIDYGYTRNEYYHPQRTDGTLLCHYRHRAHNDPFLYVGLQDITASVDFTAIAENAVTSGMNLMGFTTQAHFLMACGIDEYAGLNGADDQTELFEMTRQIKLLTLPGEMGERFKVIALGKQFNDKLTGFQIADHRNRL